MGVVYEAENVESGIRAALKTVWVPSARQLAGLRREIHVLSRLEHPGIVRILDRGALDGLPWYAMELIRGVPLTQYVRTGSAVPTPLDTAPDPLGSTAGPAELPWWTHSLVLASAGTSSPRPEGIPETRPIEDLGLADVPPTTTSPDLAPPDRTPLSMAPLPPAARVVLTPEQLSAVLVVCQRLCRALAFLHGEGIVHRDLKPENVIVRPEGMPVIVDFGLMMEFARAGREPLDAGHRAACTLAYAAPEQLLQEVVDARADLYALGCILHEMCAGQPPFWSDTPGALARHHLFTPTAPLSERVIGVPPALDDLVLRLLAKRPRERIGYALDVATALARIAEETSLPRRPASADLGPTPRTYLYRPGFAGRVGALDEIERHLEEARAGKGSIVVIEGQNGIGKTRLAMEAVVAGERLRFRVLAGECLPQVAGQTSMAGAGPLHPLRRPLQVVADLCRELGAGAADAIFGRRARLLSIYEPALGDLPGQSGQSRPAVDPRSLHALVCNALTDVLDNLTAQDPILLVIDDVHWADELTRAWLRSLDEGDRLSKMRLLVLATRRAHESSSSSELDLPNARRIHLDRLTEADVGAIVCDMLALREPPAALARFLTRVSQGNPFFVAEYLRAAVGEKLLVRDELGRWRLPEEDGAEIAAVERLALPRSLQGLVERRLAAVGAAARRLAEIAAVFGREADVSLVGRVAGLSPEALAEATVELLAAQVLAEPEPGSISFVHDKLREVAYEGIPIGARGPLHRAAAHALEEEGAPSPEVLAAAARQHELGGELEKAVELRCRAADAAEADGALPEALAQCDAAVALTTDLNDELRLKALLHRGRLRSSSGRAEAAMLDLEAALAIAEARGDQPAEVRACTHLSYAAYLLGDADRTLSFAERADRVATTLDDAALRAGAENALGIAWGSRGLYRRAIEHYGRAAEIAESIGDEASLGRHLGNLAINYRLLGELDEAKTLGTRALDIARRQGQIARECNSLVNLGLVELDRGDLAAARWAFQTGLEIAMSIDLRFALPEAHAGLAEIARREGDFALAEEHGTRGLAVAEEERHAPMVGGILRVLAAVASDRADKEGGSQNAATDLYERSVAVLRATGSHDELAMSLEALGRHLLELGRTEAGHATLEEAAVAFEALGLSERAAATRAQS